MTVRVSAVSDTNVRPQFLHGEATIAFTVVPALTATDVGAVGEENGIVNVRFTGSDSPQQAPHGL